MEQQHSNGGVGPHHIRHGNKRRKWRIAWPSLSTRRPVLWRYESSPARRRSHDPTDPLRHLRQDRRGREVAQGRNHVPEAPEVRGTVRRRGREARNRVRQHVAPRRYVRRVSGQVASVPNPFQEGELDAGDFGVALEQFVRVAGKQQGREEAVRVHRGLAASGHGTEGSRQHGMAETAAEEGRPSTRWKASHRRGEGTFEDEAILEVHSQASREPRGEAMKKPIPLFVGVLIGVALSEVAQVFFHSIFWDLMVVVGVIAVASGVGVLIIHYRELKKAQYIAHQYD